MPNRHTFLREAKDILLKEYCAKGEWVMRPKEDCKRYAFNFILESKSERRTHRILAKVKLAGHISQSLIRQFNENTRRMAGRYVKVELKILFVGPETDTGVVPDDFKVIRLGA